MLTLLNLSKETVILILAALAALICALHFTAVLARNNIAKIAQYVNIALHTVLFSALLLFRADIDVGVAVFMASAFVYTLIAYVKHLSDNRLAKKSNVKEAKNLDI